MSTKKINQMSESSEVQEDKEARARVYCGPTVRGVARQFTVYRGGEIPEALQEFLKEHPAAAGLMVSTDMFAEIRRRVEIPGTAENILLQKIKSEM